MIKKGRICNSILEKISKNLPKASTIGNENKDCLGKNQLNTCRQAISKLFKKKGNPKV